MSATKDVAPNERRVVASVYTTGRFLRGETREVQTESMFRVALFAGAAVLGSAACGEDTVKLDTTPIVSISASDTTGVAPMSVQFFSTVSGGNGALSFDWEFGDGETSEEPNPRHDFGASEQEYLVTLTVTDEDGDEASSTVRIAVGSDEMPGVTAEATPTVGAAPLAVDFGCTVAGGNQPVATSWRFGQGDGADTAQATHTYLVPGVYVARCEAKDDDGDVVGDSLTVTVGEEEIPTAALSASPVSGEAPLSVSFVGAASGGNGAITFDWVFGDGSTSTGQSDTHVYSDPGQYTAVLTVTDEDGDTDSDTVTIDVTSAP